MPYTYKVTRFCQGALRDYVRTPETFSFGTHIAEKFVTRRKIEKGKFFVCVTFSDVAFHFWEIRHHLLFWLVFHIILKSWSQQPLILGWKQKYFWNLWSFHNIKHLHFGILNVQVPIIFSQLQENPRINPQENVISRAFQLLWIFYL